MVSDSRIPILVLAAGSSNRLGYPKQLIKVDGRSLIRRTVQECIKSSVGDVIVILGSRQEEMRIEIQDLECHIIINPNWKQGMGSSIAHGVNYIRENYNCLGLILSLCDQVFVSQDIFKELSITSKSEIGIITVCKYQDGFGPPVYFGRNYFDLLKGLLGDEGGKKIIEECKEQVLYIDFPRGFIDIDIPEDLEHLK